ncbi:MAG: imidazole glycerol phosphate synthase subunit HisH [Rhodospirillaceae bacterium]|nr:imidazole glycerol phosphate synthase subunit HisH [Rhodospirillaceae bacterium]|tara:strand:- start:3198 stop:3842 length:645 start_codon:yes stop_codon:yes gene_type:complete
MNVVIVDYGSGNLRSAAKALELAAADTGKNPNVRVINDANELAAADYIVLPGVGAFGDCLAGLSSQDGMINALNEAVVSQGKPFLGICVGMQLMADRGIEHGEHAGLGWIAGDVLPIEPEDQAHKIPHMGWNDLRLNDTTHPVLNGIRDGSHAYFVHSYSMQCADEKCNLAAAEYGSAITAIIGRDNMVGTQFHPEKSQETGLALLRNFLKWQP